MGSVNKGVLIIALGHKNYYRMAVNLAASIKRNSPNIHISIVVDSIHEDNAHVFDNIISAKYDNPVEAKTDVYDLSPYDKTLYLDADMILLPDVDLEKLFVELENVDFTIMNACAGDDYSVWASADAIRFATGNTEDPLPAYYSELIYFTKCSRIESYFEAVQHEYKTATLRGRTFAGVMADELAFTLASMKLKIFPHKLNWLPVFWHFRDKKDTGMQPYQLCEKYYGYSLGGNITPAYAKAQYDNLVTYYAQVMKVTKPFKALDKRTYLSNRSKI